jgi:hypothetical protein
LSSYTLVQISARLRGIVQRVASFADRIASARTCS